MGRPVRPVITAAAGLLKPFASKTGLTRPDNTTAYAAGDLIANSVTAGQVEPLRFADVGRFAGEQLVNRSVLIQSVRVIANGAGAPTIRPRLRLYSARPFATGSYPADNAALIGAGGAMTVAALEAEQIVGEVTTWVQAHATRAYADLILANPLPMITDEDGALYGLLEAVNAAAPTAQLAYSLVIRGLH